MCSVVFLYNNVKLVTSIENFRKLKLNTYTMAIYNFTVSISLAGMSTDGAACFVSGFRGSFLVYGQL